MSCVFAWPLLGALLQGEALDTWVKIEGLPNCTWLGRLTATWWVTSWCSSCAGRFGRFAQSYRQQLGPSGTMWHEATRFGRSHATSSDESGEEIEDSVDAGFIDETRPFPCGHAGCSSFHALESGYCKKHHWFGTLKRMRLALKTQRQHLELVLLILTQAVAEVESQYLLLMILLSLFPVACYCLSQSTGVSAALCLLVLLSLSVISIAYTTARLNRMQELSKELEVQTEALYAKNLWMDMSTLFGDQMMMREDIVQPYAKRSKSLKEHFLQARKQLDKFRRDICIPLYAFLEEQGYNSRQSLQPKLKPLPLLQEAVARIGDPNRIVDLLHCDIAFDDFNSMSHAWHFLKTRMNETSGIEIVCAQDFFAVSQTGLRCAEMVVAVDNYFATIRLGFAKPSPFRYNFRLKFKLLSVTLQWLGIFSRRNSGDAQHMDRTGITRGVTKRR